MFTPPAAAGLHSSGSLKALIAALLSSSSLLIYRLYYIEDFPRCQVFYARLAGQSMQLKRYSALTRRQAVLNHMRLNCAPAQRLCLPDIDRHRGLPCARGLGGGVCVRNLVAENPSCAYCSVSKKDNLTFRKETHCRRRRWIRFPRAPLFHYFSHVSPNALTNRAGAL